MKKQIKKLQLLSMILMAATLCTACTGEKSKETFIQRTDTDSVVADSNLDLTADAAMKLVEQWVGSHPFAFYVSIDSGASEAVTIDGEDFYMFNLFANSDYEDASTWLIDVFVNKKTGELIKSESYALAEIVDPEPLDEWYNNFMSRKELDDEYVLDDQYKDNDGPDEEYNYTEDVYSPQLDSSLVGGRWVANDGTRLEFFNDGTATIDMDTYNALWGDLDLDLKSSLTLTKKDITWEASNGALVLTAHHTRQYEYDYDHGETIYDEVGPIYNDWLTLKGIDGVPGAGLKRNSEGTGLIGVWMPYSHGGGGLEIREDGTANDQMSRLGDCTWSADDTILTLQYDQGWGFDYTVNGSTFTLYSGNGNVVFTRIGN